jgi:hypothetical protein
MAFRCFQIGLALPVHDQPHRIHGMSMPVLQTGSILVVLLQASHHSIESAPQWLHHIGVKVTMRPETSIYRSFFNKIDPVIYFGAIDVYEIHKHFRKTDMRWINFSSAKKSFSSIQAFTPSAALE